MDQISCDICSNKASVYFTQIIDGKMQKVNLCEKCAKEKGVTDPTGFALADLLFGIGQQQNVTHKGAGGPRECPICGMTAELLKKTGRVGCARCYAVFGESLGSILRAMHKGTSHTGKIPAHRAERRAHAMQLESLRHDLDKAVTDERFEDAARFRDAIISLEKGTANAAPPRPAARAT